MAKQFQSLVTRLEKKLKAGFDETGLDRNKQEPLLEAERLELRVSKLSKAISHLNLLRDWISRT